MKKSTLQEIAPQSENLEHRVTVLETSASNNHSEVMRILNDLTQSVSEVKTDVKSIIVQQSSQEVKIEGNTKDCVRLESRINRLTGAIGTVMIAAVSGVFAVITKYFIGLP